MGSDHHASGWPAVQLLAEPTRRRVFEVARAARRPVTREEVAAAAGTSRRLAAFHLDQLAGAGLLAVDYARPVGRGGPGAGRPAKRYVVPPGDVSVSLPMRRYDLAARILARAVSSAGVASAGTAGPTPAAATLSAAATEGHRIGQLIRSADRPPRSGTLAGAESALHDLGYEPARETYGLRLRNCPFHAVVDVDPALVCGMNQCFVGGLLAGLGGLPDVTAALHPGPPDCCVRIVAPLGVMKARQGPAEGGPRHG
jgi:predicted ArsR family transcriptional regulator